jgi:transcription initiation factor TFIIE subunit alpha
MMGMQSKELHKLCGKLREDRFLAVYVVALESTCSMLTLVRHTRSEAKEGQQRPINKTWYYIDYRATIDAIKWRVYRIDKAVQGNTVPLEDRKDFNCPRCKSQWTQMEVLDKFDPERGFLCHKCGFPLVRNAEDNRGGHEQSTRLNAQFRFITDLLPKIDLVVIPDNTFETALASARPVYRDQLNPTSETAPIDSGTNKPTAVKGLTNTGPTSIAVTVTTSDGPTAADRAAEQARKEALLAQNQLPSHFTHSTVTGEAILPQSTPTFKISDEENKEKKDALITAPSFVDGAEIDSYFAQLKAEQAREAVKEQEEELETDDEDEDDDLGFEDVVPATGSGVGTPASSASAADPKALASGLAGVLKRRDTGTGTGSSNGGTSTGAATPVTGPQTPDSGRAAKKVRIEEPLPKDDEESEEDIEFEDV